MTVVDIANAAIGLLAGWATGSWWHWRRRGLRAEGLARDDAEWLGHTSWRCEHRPRFYLVGGTRDGRCPCGLDEHLERRSKLLGRAKGGLDAE